MVSDEEFKREILEKLDVLTKLVAVSANVQNLLAEKNQKDQIKILADLGLSRNIIALVVGTTPETVSVRLSEMKSRKQSDKKSIIASKEGDAEK